jgi:hypothetical protein
MKNIKTIMNKKMNSNVNSRKKLISINLECFLIHRGKKCKFCNSNWPLELMAIDGIYSNWFFFKCFYNFFLKFLKFNI